MNALKTATLVSPLLVVALALPAVSQRATNTRAEQTPTFASFVTECRTTTKMTDDCTGLLLNGAEYTGYKDEAARCPMANFWAGYDLSPNRTAIAEGNWDVGIGALIAEGVCTTS